MSIFLGIMLGILWGLCLADDCDNNPPQTIKKHGRTYVIVEVESE